jgi:soluble lytic murein transglycosylase-like protein
MRKQKNHHKNHRRAGLAFLLFLAGMLWTDLAQAADYCTPYIQRAEKKYHIPRNLLMAIALVESGKDGKPWPWALNYGGTALYPATYEEAVRYLRDSNGKVKNNIAIGCMQVYSGYHAHKFSAVEWLLHPEYNVSYAAQLLARLYRTHGNWTKAVAFYHASTNKRAQYDYVCTVFRTVNRIRNTKPSPDGIEYCSVMPKQKAMPPKPPETKTRE